MSSISTPAASRRRTASAIAPRRSPERDAEQPVLELGTPVGDLRQRARQRLRHRSCRRVRPRGGRRRPAPSARVACPRRSRDPGRSPRSGARAGRPRRGIAWSGRPSSPRRRASRSPPRALSRLRRSSPVVGSSRKSSGGRATSAAARSSRRRIPPEYVLTRRSPSSASAEVGEQLARALLRRTAAEVVQAPDHLEVLEAAEVLVHGGVLAGEADSLADELRLRDDVEAGNARRTAVRLDQRREDANGGRLPGSVRPQQPEHAARLHAEVDAAQRVDVAVALAQPLGFDGGVRRHPLDVTDGHIPIA